MKYICKLCNHWFILPLDWTPVDWRLLDMKMGYHALIWHGTHWADDLRKQENSD